MSNSAISGPIFSDNKRAPSGTAAAPSFAFNDSTGTGVYLVSPGVLGLSTNGVQRVVVDASGNVGIGTSTPQVQLEIATTGDPTETFYRPTNNVGNGIGRLFWDANNASSTRVSYARIQTEIEGNVAGSHNGRLLFSTATNGSVTEKMRLDASGNLLVGTANATVSADNGFRFIPSPVSANMTITVNTSNGADSNYHLYNRNATNNGYRFYVGANGGILNYSANNVNLSDQRVKTDISLAGSYLEKICAIPVKTFRYKDQGNDMDLTLGVIAQDVEAIAPELVNITDGFGDLPEDGVPLKTIYQTDLQYALMKCIQELKEKNDALEARLAALESK